MVTGFIFLREFHFFITLQLDQDVTVWWSKTSPCSGRPKGKSIHPLFKACCSSKMEAQSSAFPSYFLSELPLGRLPALLPCCVSQTSTDVAEPTLAFGSCFSAQAGCRAPAQTQPQAQGGTVIPRCARPWSSPGRAHLELTPPRELFWDGEG